MIRQFCIIMKIMMEVHKKNFFILSIMITNKLLYELVLPKKAVIIEQDWRSIFILGPDSKINYGGYNGNLR